MILRAAATLNNCLTLQCLLQTMTKDEMRLILSDLGWSQNELCRRLGLHVNTAAKWEDKIPEYAAAYLRLKAAWKAMESL